MYFITGAELKKEEIKVENQPAQTEQQKAEEVNNFEKDIPERYTDELEEDAMLQDQDEDEDEESSNLKDENKKGI